MTLFPTLWAFMEFSIIYLHQCFNWRTLLTTNISISRKSVLFANKTRTYYLLYSNNIELFNLQGLRFLEVAGSFVTHSNGIRDCASPSPPPQQLHAGEMRPPVRAANEGSL